jgi:hypothetical protein
MITLVTSFSDVKYAWYELQAAALLGLQDDGTDSEDLSDKE